MKKEELLQILNHLQNLPAETETVEFKKVGKDFDFSKLGKYFSALSNEANLKNKPCAWLVFGIEPVHHQVVGSNYRSNRKLLDNLKKEIADKTTNRITFIEIYELLQPEGRVIMFQIPAAPKGIPTAFEGHFYGRDGESLVALNMEEWERIRKQNPLNDWSAEICKDADISELDGTAIQKARDNYKIKNPRIVDEIDTWDIETFLTKTKVMAKGKLTRTAILLLGKPESVVHLNPTIPQITWVLYTKDGVERDYEHFKPPYILAIDHVFAKIRNIKYRYLKEGTLFPDEVDQYTPQNMREALNNCIAHMDYSLSGRIGVAENEDGYLSFINPGTFLPGNIESVINSMKPPTFYRNPLLVSTMVDYNMIDSIGSGIKRMFLRQKEKFFPMPDYDFENRQVKATLTGKIIDMEYARMLAKNRDLSLNDIILLDKVQKKRTLSKEEESHLRKQKLIEGRKPNYYISVHIAQKTNQKAEYSKNKALDKQYYLDFILKAIKQHDSMSRPDIDKLLWNKLPDWMDDKQKKNKIGNLISELRMNQKIKNAGTDRNPVWEIY